MEQIVDVRVVARGDDQPLPRHGAKQLVELRLDGLHVLEDVGMVVLDVVDDEGARAVVDELSAAVEVGGVVFVGLDHEERRLSQLGGAVEVLRRTADQVAGFESGAFQYPSQHAGGGGLAVGARHGQHPTVPQHVGAQPLRAGCVAQAAVENVLHGGFAPRQPGVAHDHKVGSWLQLGCTEALVDPDAVGGQQVAHGRVDAPLVRAADLMALLLGEQRQAAHQGAADAEKVDSHPPLARLASAVLISIMPKARPTPMPVWVFMDLERMKPNTVTDQIMKAA